MTKDIRSPISIQFEVTSKCNLNCLMCYNGSGRYRDSELPDEEWYRLAREFCEYGILEAIVSGGEPLLRGKSFLLNLFSIFTEYNVDVHLITNGTFVDEEFVRALRDFNIEVAQTSVDGENEEIHNSIRGADFHKVVRATHLLARYGFNTRVASTVSRLNEDHVQDIIELAVRLGANTIIIDQFLPVGRAIKNFDGLKCSRSHENMRDEIRHYQEKYAKLIKIQIPEPIDKQLKRLEAAMYTEGAIVRPDGELRLSCISPFSAGNLRDKNVVSFWEQHVAYAWKTEAVQNFVRETCAGIPESDAAVLVEQYKKLGVMNGFENYPLNRRFIGPVGE